MPTPAKALTASTDRTVPPFDADCELEPNYFCRARNTKRGKYCRSRAGTGTSHTGVGRCKKHGGLKRAGDDRVTSGKRSAVKRQQLGELIAQERQRVDPLDLSGELATLRALVADLRDRNPDAADHDSEVKLAESIGRMVERIERIRSQNAISRPELNRIMHELWRAVDGRIADETVKGAIRDDWMRISL